MATPTIIPPSTELTQELEQVTADLPEVERELAEARLIEQLPVLRLSVIVGCTTVAASIMTGGIFLGSSPRVYAALAGIIGIAIGARASRVQRPATMYALVVGGVFLTGVVLLLPNMDAIFSLGKEMRAAIKQGDVLRPPVEFLSGWRAILCWIMAIIGFTASWVAIELRKPALGLLVPLPVLAIAAISVPDSQQLVSGLVCLVLFVVALGILSGTQQRGEDDQPVSLAYEVRRAIRALPLIGGVVVLLAFAARSNLLFPAPLYDPAQEAKRPRAVPLSKVKDRVLFTVEAKFTGPWKMGSLDVYDGRDWRLPPFAQSQLAPVKKTGIVNEDFKDRQDVLATFSVQGLTGAILPDLPNTVGVKAVGPKLAYDSRSGVIRVSQGTIRPGFQYVVAAAGIPQIERLRQADAALPSEVKPFLEIPSPPQAVQSLLKEAPKTSNWDKLDFMRQYLLQHVSASGAGSPKSITPARVQDLLVGSKTGTPFELVAAQAMLARWSGIPSRIGYGFDGGDEIRPGLLEIRPKHGAVFLEIFFADYGWLPVIGDPLQAKQSFSDSPQQFSTEITPSEDVSVRLFFPFFVPERTSVLTQVRTGVAVVVPIVVGLLLIYYLWPLPYKAFRRARRRSWAADHGMAERIAVAYAEWRDYCIDYGYRYETDTPLMFLERVIPDEEHAELSWLVTRCLWGDLTPEVTWDDVHAAEELSSSLKRRLSQAHAITLRFVASLSRLSIKHPYAPDLDPHYQRLREAASDKMARLEAAHASA
jgi:hypothetical protein